MKQLVPLGDDELELGLIRTRNSLLVCPAYIFKYGVEGGCRGRPFGDLFLRSTGSHTSLSYHLGQDDFGVLVFNFFSFTVMVSVSTLEFNHSRTPTQPARVRLKAVASPNSWVGHAFPLLQLQIH